MIDLLKLKARFAVSHILTIRTDHVTFLATQ